MDAAQSALLTAIGQHNLNRARAIIRERPVLLHSPLPGIGGSPVMSPIFFAAGVNAATIVRHLVVDLRVDVNATVDLAYPDGARFEGFTALTSAARGGAAEAAEMLLKLGASPEPRSVYVSSAKLER